ncbi:hypothetical protein [Propionispora hippei]|uniref:Uncharacterized protein n=1 Tax=Propionispora hippei DSM 15287 TaxID=1123003 RepID=A0A1M6F3A7_9FIRM|nr:hypothetical protein [Propionispora hippei]SHI92187.1 hypothetical protein SAMN02745170_01352 [Propionispora hippei DSM 15287]
MPIRMLDPLSLSNVSTQLSSQFQASIQLDPEALKEMTARAAANPPPSIVISQDQYNSIAQNCISSEMQNDDFAFSISDCTSPQDAQNWQDYFKQTALTSQSIQQDLAATNPDTIDGNVYYQDFNGTRITSATDNGTDYLNNLIVKSSFYKSELQSNFQGDDLQARVNSLDNYVNNLVENFAQKTADKISNKLQSTDPTSSLTDDKIKTDILNIFQDNSQQMQEIISANPDKWQTILQTGGDYLNYFRNKLETATTTTTTTNTNTAESNTGDELNYSGLKNLIQTTAGIVAPQEVNQINLTSNNLFGVISNDIDSIIRKTYLSNSSDNQPYIICITA